MSRLSTVAVLCGVAALAAVAAAGDPLEGEIGLLAGQHDNFFFRGEGSAAPESDLLTGYLELEKGWRVGSSELVLGFSGSTVDVTDIPNADYQSLALSGTVKRGRHRIALEYGELINRLFSESGDAVFFDESSVELQWRVTLGQRWWVRARWEEAEWDFDPLENSRDADIRKLSLTGRFAVSDRLGIRIGWLDEERIAVGPENNRVGSGFELALEGTPGERTTWFLRFRQRDRDYEDAPLDERNFGRSDTVNDINFNVRWRFAEQIGLYLRDSYRDGDSTRLDRNYTGNVAEAGLFFRF